MTISLAALLTYAGALAVLVATPGPVVAALIARAATGGVAASVPLAAGVAVGDLIWPLVAMLGLGVAVEVWAGIMVGLRWFGAAILVWMGLSMIRNARAEAVRLTGGGLAKERGWAGFVAGLAVIAGNPKAILFYLGVLPGFFSFATLGRADVVVICLVSALVPFLGNMAWAALFARARRFLANPVAMRRVHLVAGAALIAVGAVIAVA